MSEDKDLLSRIAQLAGHINLHKVNTPTQEIGASPVQTWSQPTISSHRRRNSYQPGHVFQHSRRGVRVGKPSLYSHRNRSLVLNNAAPSMTAVDETRIDSPGGVAINTTESSSSGNLTAQAATGWISKRDRHMQLINSSIYDREANIRSKAIDETRRQVAKRRDEREISKINKHLQKIADNAATISFSPRLNSEAETHELSINGLRFRVCDGGSKLVRIMSEVT
ncbi:hypothetical protein MMC30_008803 [Trapelia coarctata]|nr:hypothetical protein [Trapelia coarctata]